MRAIVVLSFSEKARGRYGANEKVKRTGEMKLLERAQLPIFMDECSHRLEFRDGLLHDSDGSKAAGDMLTLLRDPSNIDQNEKCYDFYRDIVYEKDRALFQKYDFRYDITVIAPGTINGECKKTSGHYHGYFADGSSVYPEVYEVLEGKALYVLQKAANFDKKEEPVFEDRKAVFVDAGQAIIVPPFYGHCSINIGDGPMVFSNIAVVACPLHYNIIEEKHGLSFYALKDKNGAINLENNKNYANVSDIEKAFPLENPDLGIRFGHSVYHEFVKAPEKFDFLLHPEAYLESILNMYQ